MLRASVWTIVLAGLITLAGCNTLTGVGRDISLIGSGLQGGADAGAEFAETMFEQDTAVSQSWPVETQPMPTMRRGEQTQQVYYERTGQDEYLRYYESYNQFHD